MNFDLENNLKDEFLTSLKLSPEHLKKITP